MASRKSLPPDQAERVREAARKVVAERFGGANGPAAKAIGISHAYLSQVLAGHVGGGLSLLDGLANVTGLTINEIRFGAPVVAPPADPMACEHPNEAPRACPCRADCYCKTRTCKPVGPVVHRDVKPETVPIPMLIWCPMCRARHLDVGEFATKPHHTHSCQECGLTWRPAVVPTVGVEFLPGFKNEPEASP